MSLVEVLLLALGLSMDAFTVAVGKGLSMRRVRVSQALAIAASFGLFQALMPAAGWLIGSQFAALIEQVAHWIAFGLLLLLGGSMVRGALGTTTENGAGEARGLGVRELLMLSVATSIDALAAGVGFAVLHLDIIATVTTIGVVTAVLSFAGVFVGYRFGSSGERPALLLGGLILVGIGVKVVFEHYHLLPG